MGLKVTCDRCDSVLQHHCNTNVQGALEALLRWVPNAVEPAVEKAMKKSAYSRRPEDAEAPFFGSQGWSYSIFGKEEARTFHALVHNVVRALGLDPNALELKFEQERRAEKAELDRRAALRSEQQRNMRPVKKR